MAEVMRIDPLGGQRSRWSESLAVSALMGRDVKSGDFQMINGIVRRSAAITVPAVVATAGEASSTDEMLVSRIANGDKLAMQVLFARHRTPVYRWLLRFVGNETVAEDLLSDVFFDVWQQADRFEGRSAVATWLLAIARFKALRPPPPNGCGVG
jgi:Sigma-70 region 2